MKKIHNGILYKHKSKKMSLIASESNILVGIICFPFSSKLQPLHLLQTMIL